MSYVQPRDINDTLWVLETDGLSKTVEGGGGGKGTVRFYVPRGLIHSRV